MTGTQELVWEPGSAQVDFGEADFNEDTDCVRRKYLTTSFPFSNDGFSQIFGGETAECVCQGLQDIFQYIDGVPHLLVFDNATCVGRRICEKVVETELFSRFRAQQLRFPDPVLQSAGRVGKRQRGKQGRNDPPESLRTNPHIP